MCVFLISPVPITEPLTSELIDTPVFYNLAPRPIKYRVSVPIPSRHALFPHDNDPKHTSKATAGFLKKNRVKVIQWSSMSPDLNPIEHLWGILKRQVEHHSPSSIQSLKEVILEEWKKIVLAKCRQLVHSMPRRLGAVIKNHGGHTKH